MLVCVCLNIRYGARMIFTQDICCSLSVLSHNVQQFCLELVGSMAMPRSSTLYVRLVENIWFSQGEAGEAKRCLANGLFDLTSSGDAWV